jgi:hypothetical protein
LSTVDFLITTVELGPGFLNDHDPDFISVGSREVSTIMVAGELIINDDLLFMTVVCNLDG